MKASIEKTDVAGKRVLMRVDFNVPLEEGAITDDRRIRMSLPGISSVLTRGGKLILMSHLGRPEGTGFESSGSLKLVAERLRELLPGTTVHFPSQDCVDDAAAAAVAACKPGEVVLLENLRFHKAEKKGDAAFAAKLAAYGDIYCNDAFGTAHRADASMVAVPQAMQGRPRVAGPLMAKEIQYLQTALQNAERPVVVILGGSKVSDKIGAIEHMGTKAGWLLIGGAMSYTLLKSMGRKVGKSLVEEKMLGTAKKLIEGFANSPVKGMVPVDHVCGKELAQGTPVQVVGDSIPDGWMGLDIGPETVSRYTKVIDDARTVVWNGPMGAFETVPFDAGTRAIARAVAGVTKRGGTTVVCGGDTAAAVAEFGMADQYSHVSTGGGASLELLEGRTFESLEVLDNA